MEILDYTPVPKRFRFMTGQTWKLTFKINDVTGAVNLNNSDITAIITSPQGSKTYLTKSDGISVSTDGKFFVLKKDWTSLTTDQNDNVMMNPSLQILPKGTLTLQVFITDETGTDTTPIFMYIDVVDIPSDSSEYRMNANTTIEVTLNDGVLIGVGVQPISDRIEWRRVGFRIDVRYIGESTWTEWANFSSINKGDTGLSAYELAVQQGFVGTISEWLTSLKVKDGRFIGLYNATTNSPTLSAVPAQGVLDGDFYRIAVGGTIPFAGQNFTANTVCYEGDMIGKIGNQWFLLKYGYGQMMQRVTEAATSATQAAASATQAATSATTATQKAAEAATQAAQALASATTATAVSQGNATARPTSRPSFLLDAANTRFIDPRLAFVRNTIGTYIDKFGILKIAKTGQPRFHHDPITRECLGLLMETGKTNLFNYSNDFTNGQYVKNQTSIVASSIPAPDLSNAAKLIEDTSNNDHNMNRGGISVTAGKKYTASVFVKAAERTRINLALSNSSTYGGSNPSAIFDLATGTLVSSNNVAKTPKIEAYPNGWFRIQVTQTASVSSTSGVNIQLIAAGTSVNYVGDGSSGLYIFGEQFEAGTRASSYMPTSNTTFTRADDFISIDNTLFTELFPFLSEGSMYVCAQKGFAEESIYPSFFGFFGTNTAGGQNAIRITNLLADTTFTASVYTDGVSNSTIYTINESTDISTAMTWKQGSIKSFNSAQNGTVFSGNIPSNLYTAQIQGFNGCLKQIAIWNRQLNDTEAQNLANSGLVGKRNNQVPAVSDLAAMAFLSPYSVLRSINRQHFSIDCTGASQTRNIRFPFDFTYEVVDSTGVTITTAPSATCTANTDYPLVINGAAGKTFSYAITPIFEY